MVLGPWYFRKRLLITLSIAIILSGVWVTFLNRRYLYSKFFHTSNITSTGTTTPYSKKINRKYSFMAFLNFQRSDESVNCGGTLINKRHILTAAHCLEGADSVWIILGTDNIEKEEKSALRLESETFIIHENFSNSTYDNDIALIYLDRDVLINENIGVISLISPNVTMHNISSVVLGWGLDITQGLNDELLAKNVTVVDDTFCYLASEEEFDSKMCAFAFGDSGPCHGDSGGPLLFENGQIGIVSGGNEDCNASVPTVYTDTTYYWEWIEKKMT